MLTVIVFNVGQGQSILIVLPPDGDSKGKRRYGMIDCYYEKLEHDEPPVLTYLKKNKATHLEFVILTHPDRDHFFGLSKVLTYFSSGGRSLNLFIETPLRVAEAAVNKYRLPKNSVTECYNELIRIWELTGRRVSECEKTGKPAPLRYRWLVKAGQGIRLTHDLKAQILSPFENASTRMRNDITENMVFHFDVNKDFTRELPKRIDSNQVCLAIKFVYGTSVFLVCGDTPSAAWDKIIKYSAASRCSLTSDLISVGHHGSSKGNPVCLWRTVAKKNDGEKSVAAISCGYSTKCRRPARSTLRYIFKNGVELYCTNKGYYCHNLNVLPVEEIALRKIKAQPEIEKAVSGLGGIEQVCSGDCIFGLSSGENARLIHREQEAECVFRQDFEM